jgi:glycosyltransferase involved in cell wall biosynthesis
MPPKPSIAVVSPFLDKRHGTEMCVAEQLERLACEYEIHLYSARVEDVDLTGIHWHRVPTLPGPHLAGYLWWFVANQVVRWWDRRLRGLTPSLVYSPGINCLDADVISVHIVFAEFHRQVEKELRLRSNPFTAWPLLIHRRLYYRLAEALERRVYSCSRVPLAIISRKVAADLERSYGRKENLHLIYYGCDFERFQPLRRSELRAQARHEFGLRENEFAVLLIGNDWKKKGLACLLEAAGRPENSNLRLLIVGKDAMAPYQDLLLQGGLVDRVHFLPLRRDVEFYYAAADVYAGPSLEDAFALPPFEAMACGMPVIVSRQAGVSELIHHGEDGLILEDPSDSEGLARLIREVQEVEDLRVRLGRNAVRTATRYTWESNATQLRDLFDQVRRQKKS